MKSTLKILATILLSIIVPGVIAAQRTKVTPMYLEVAIDDLTSQVAGIRSDDPDNDPATANSYTHGIDSVTARFTENGYLEFKSGTRRVRAVYSMSLGDSQTTNNLPSEDFRQNVVIMTYVGDGIMQNMPIGEVRCQKLTVNIPMGDSAGTQRTIGYRAGRGTLTNTGYVKVSHPAENTWFLESDPLGACPNGANESVARVRDAKTKGKTVPDIDYGRFIMPLRLVVTRR